MIRDKFLKILILCMLFFLFFTGCVFAQINWRYDLNQALYSSKHSNKAVFMYMFTEKAKWCKRYDQLTFPDPALISLLNKNYIPLRINIQNDRATATKYGVFRVPSILILDSAANEKTRILTYYPADKLLRSLNQLKTSSTKNNTAASAPSNTVPNIQTIPGAIFYEPFESLFGWGNDGSSENSTAQISLVQGIKGNAFKVEYELVKNKWNYVQIHRELSPSQRVKLPEHYTLKFNLAGRGGHGELNIKLADQDGTNYGGIFPLPVDNKAHTMTINSKDIKYLWGGKDKVLDSLCIFLIAITPTTKKPLPPGPDLRKGIFYIDELVIMPGIQN
jgi:uncharacterized protein DUF255